MWDVISLKRLIDSTEASLLRSALDDHGATLGVVAEAGAQVCPAVGTRFRDSLLELRRQLATEQAAESTAERARNEIRQWGDEAAEYYRGWAAEMKDLFINMARNIQGLGERDHCYAQRLTEFRKRLEAGCKLDDLSEVHALLFRSAAELKTCVEQMAQENRATVEQLRGELSSSQARIERAERLASVDSLTGLDNRRKIRKYLEFRTTQERPFSIIVFAVKSLQRINQQYGRVACDQMLMQFGTELRSAFRASDVLGRWDEGEFIAVVDCTAEEAAAHIQRVSQWCVGSYLVQVGGETCTVDVEAGAGTAEWQPGEPAANTIARAAAQIKNA